MIYYLIIYQCEKNRNEIYRKYNILFTTDKFLHHFN